jgi:hypothetical protein
MLLQKIKFTNPRTNKEYYGRIVDYNFDKHRYVVYYEDGVKGAYPIDYPHIKKVEETE